MYGTFSPGLLLILLFRTLGLFSLSQCYSDSPSNDFQRKKKHRLSSCPPQFKLHKVLHRWFPAQWASVVLQVGCQTICTIVSFLWTYMTSGQTAFWLDHLVHLLDRLCLNWSRLLISTWTAAWLPTGRIKRRGEPRERWRIDGGTCPRQSKKQLWENRTALNSEDFIWTGTVAKAPPLCVPRYQTLSNETLKPCEQRRHLETKHQRWPMWPSNGIIFFFFGGGGTSSGNIQERRKTSQMHEQREHKGSGNTTQHNTAQHNTAQHNTTNLPQWKKCLWRPFSQSTSSHCWTIQPEAGLMTWQRICQQWIQNHETDGERKRGK